MSEGDFYTAVEYQGKPAQRSHPHAANALGRRDDMEDFHAIHCGPAHLHSQEPVLFGVFDGHGGPECARYLAQNLCSLIADHDLFGTNPERALVESFEELDRQYIALARQLELDDGSTASVLLLQYDGKANKLKYYCACSGDSRAIIVKHDGSARALIEDHNPAREDERKRIQAEGGEVLYDVDHGIYRVASPDGSGLAVTRALGDANFKPFVTARPEVASGQVEPDDAFICVASDGLWGDVDNDEAGKIFCKFGVGRAPTYCIDEAFARGSEDNITCIGINLQEAVVRLAAEWNRRSRKLTEEASESLLLSHARALSQRLSVGSSMHSPKNQVDDVHLPLDLPGVRVFSNDLVLWRDPLSSLLWFALGNLFGFATVVMGYPVIPQICIALLFRLITSFLTFRVAHRLVQLGALNASQEDVQKFVDRYQVVSAATITNFTGAIIATLLEISRRWENIVLYGSVTSVLFALRTVTYVYVSISVAFLAWIIFFVVFSVPAVYTRNKPFADEQIKRVVDRFKLEQLKMEQKIKPYRAALRERLNAAKISLGLPIQSPKESHPKTLSNGEKRRSASRPLSPKGSRKSLPKPMDPGLSDEV